MGHTAGPVFRNDPRGFAALGEWRAAGELYLCLLRAHLAQDRLGGVLQGRLVSGAHDGDHRSVADELDGVPGRAVRTTGGVSQCWDTVQVVHLRTRSALHVALVVCKRILVGDRPRITDHEAL